MNKDKTKIVLDGPRRKEQITRGAFFIIERVGKFIILETLEVKEDEEDDNVIIVSGLGEYEATQEDPDERIFFSITYDISNGRGNLEKINSFDKPPAHVV